MDLLFPACAAALALLAWRFKAKGSSTHGSAAWSTVWAAFWRGHFRRKGLRVGDWTGRLSLFYDGAHAITFGATGSWKGIAAILPNLLSLRWVFLVDPGGENTAIAAKWWRKAGLPFGCINVFGMFPQQPWALPAQGFNPLDLLDANSPTFAADALLFAEMLTPRTGHEGSSTSYFKDAAQTAKRAMIIHIKTTEAPARQNIATLYRYANSSAGRWEALLAAMKASAVCGGLVAQEAVKLERIEAQAPEEFSAIMSTIQQDLSFLADPLVREMLSRPEVDFSLLKGRHAEKGGIISVVLPLEYIESHAAITRLALACAVLELQRAPLAKNKVVFVIDEAAALGKLLRLPNWLATLRRYRVGIWSIWQNLGQLVHLYERNSQTIIGNCGLRQILGVGDLETAQYAERLLGKSTVETISTNSRGEKSKSETARPLMLADEILHIRKSSQIVFIDNLHPVWLKKTPYWKRPELAGRFYPNPYHAGRTPGLSPLDLIGALWGALYYMLVWWLTPHPLAACIAAVPVALWLLAQAGIGTG